MATETTTILCEDAAAEFEIDDSGGDSITARFVFEAGVRVSATLSRQDAIRIGCALMDAGQSTGPIDDE